MNAVEQALKKGTKKRAKKQAEAAAPLRLNLGSGPMKMEGFLSVDAIAFPGVDVVADLTQRWPWEDDSIDEAHCSHFLEHLTNFNGKWERVHFFNELWRVLKEGAKCSLIVPHWCSNRYYGDPTHKEPISEMAMFYVSREWRKSQAPHTDSEHNPNGYRCNFEATWGYSMHESLTVRSQEYQQFALANYKEAALDMHIALTKRA